MSLSLQTENESVPTEKEGSRLAAEITSGRVCWKCGETYDDSYTVCPIDGVSLVSIGESTKKDPNVGSLFDGRYLITRKLGEGGMGIVYAARQIDFDREVAIKILKMSYVSNRDVRRRFMYEARTISNLKHPNALRLYDFGQSPSGNVYMVMELLNGESLADRLANEFVSYRQIFNMLIPICGVLAEAHHNGVIHRDLKPENIYIGKIEGQEEFYKLLDFGIAKHLESNLLTQSGILWGTPAYMSPEQILGMSVSSATDIYAIGVMLYELISGRLPFNAETPVGLAMKHLAAPVRSLRTIPGLSGVPQPLDDLILSALNKEPEKRPASMEVFVELLASIRDQFFDAESLEIIAPHQIDVQKYDEWIRNEPAVGKAPEKVKDIYELSRSIGGFEYAKTEGVDVGQVESDKIRIPRAHLQPSMLDIMRQGNQTNVAWLVRHQSDAQLGSVASDVEVRQELSGDAKIAPNPREYDITREINSLLEAEEAAYDSLLEKQNRGKLDSESQNLKRKNRGEIVDTKRVRFGEKNSLNPTFDRQKERTRATPDLLNESSANKSSRLSQISDQNFASARHRWGAKSRVYHFVQDKKTRIAIYVTIGITFVLLVAFWVARLNIERHTPADAFPVTEGSLTAVVGKGPTPSPVVAPVTTSAPAPTPTPTPTSVMGPNPTRQLPIGTAREIAIRFGVVTALATIQTAENFARDLVEARRELEEEKESAPAKRPRRKPRRLDKDHARKLLQGTF